MAFPVGLKKPALAMPSSAAEAKSSSFSTSRPLPEGEGASRIANVYPRNAAAMSPPPPRNAKTRGAKDAVREETPEAAWRTAPAPGEVCPASAKSARPVERPRLWKRKPPVRNQISKSPSSSPSQ